MHRWFFANEETVCKKATTPITPPTPDIRTSSSEFVPDTLWRFLVKFKGKLCSNESIGVTGNIKLLGNWNVKNCVQLNKVNDSSSLWSIDLILPRKENIKYRYLIYAENGHGQRIVRFNESKKKPRVIKIDAEQNLETLEYETFGLIKKRYKVRRGWLTHHIMVVQFKFFQAPYILRDKKDCPLLYIKTTLLRMKNMEKCTKSLKHGEEENAEENQEENEEEEVSSEGEEEEKCSISEDGNDEEKLKSTFAFCEVAVLQQENGAFHYQPKYGTACGSKDMLVFNCTLEDFKRTVYLIDLYRYPKKAASEVPPYHFGYLYIYPQHLKRSYGELKLNIMCATKHQPVGTISCEYLLVKHLKGHKFDLEKTPHMPPKKAGIDIAHRGCGNSFWYMDDILRESTINSFNLAFEHGADMIEFDVHLTKDKIPVIYHDFQLYVSKKYDYSEKEYDIFHIPLTRDEINQLKSTATVLKSGLIAIPIANFTLEQLSRVKVYEKNVSDSASNPCQKGDNQDNKPFVTLEQLFQKLPIKLGFNVEVKYCQKLTNGRWEEDFIPELDMNEYCDIMLNTVLKLAGSRNIVFTSFNVDLCTMIRLKQNRFPVMILCDTHWADPKLRDPRGETLLSAAYFSYAMGLFGVVANSRDLFELSDKILYGLNCRMIAWGKEARYAERRKEMRAFGVGGIIFDRCNHVLEPKDLIKNIVFIDLIAKKEEQNEY